MNRLSNVYFVVNANSKIGFGHLKRCMLLSDEFAKKNITSSFICYDISPKAKIILEKKHKSICLENKQMVVDFLSKPLIDSSLIAFDTDEMYFYDSKIQKKILNTGAKFLFISIKNVEYFSHFLFNQNLMSLTEKYNIKSYAKTFLGPDYFIMDDKLQSIKPNVDKADKKNLLITFGSADPGDITLKLLDILPEIEMHFDTIRIVVGGLNKKKEKIVSNPFVLNNPDKVEIHIDTNEIYKIMENTDVCLTAMGLTFWELTLHNIPSLAISGTEREKSQIGFFCDKNYAYYIGDYDDDDWHNKWLKNIEQFFDEKPELKVSELSSFINPNGKEKLVNCLINLF